MVHGGYLQDWLSEPNDYNWRVEASGDGGSQAIADIGTHWFNVAEYVAGTRVVAVVADLRTFVPTRLRPREQVGTYQRGVGVHDEVAITAEDSALILLRFADGSIGSCVISQISPGRKNKLTLEVAGSRSTLAWDHEISPGSLWIGSREESRLVSGLAAPPRDIGADPLPVGLPEGWGEALRDLFIPFYAAIAQGSPVSLEEAPYPSFLDGLRAASFVEAALESGRSGRWVALPDA
jgi:predicted dehydrogenase